MEVCAASLSHKAGTKLRKLARQKKLLAISC
jgi:hypothetical protein